ncbi:vWA domain-containing protein [Virgibacillus flavescens]|uniref:vWA domain-containing protein n=1 Tax=Virgibacillus flavescens TaxID=1611422 RepID=UPI003D34434A
MIKKHIMLHTLLLITLALLSACNNEDSKITDDNNSSPEQVGEKDSEQKKEVNTEETGRAVHKEKTTIIQNAPPIPSDATGFVNQLPGEFAGKEILAEDVTAKLKEEFKELPPLSENATQKELDQLFNYFYSLVSEDYPDPQNIIKKWEFGSFGNPKLPDSKYYFKENYNIEIILDSSGSMANVIDGKTRMELAKETINNFLKNVPEKANVSLRVYGHKGTGSDTDKKMSCSAIEQVYGFAPYDEQKFQKALNQFKPSGWTPIAGALKQSKEALKKFDAKNNTNLIYLVSDGIGTCDGEPVKIAKSLSKSNAQPIINIIGYQADATAQKQLQEMADVSDGVYSTVNDSAGLQEEFDRAEEVLQAWKEWKEDALQEADFADTDSYFDILGITNEWSFTTDSQQNTLYNLMYVAEEAGIINFKQQQNFQSRANKMRDIIKGFGKEIEGELKKISTDKINDLKKSINEKYNTQTQN